MDFTLIQIRIFFKLFVRTRVKADRSRTTLAATSSTEVEGRCRAAGEGGVGL